MIITPNKRFVFILTIVLSGILSGCAGTIRAIHLNKSAEYSQKGEYRAAIDEANKALAINQSYHLAYINRGNAYQNLREYDNAIADYRHAIALQPEEALTHLSYIHLLIYLRRVHEAEEYAQDFLRTHPQSLLIKIGLADVFLAQKRYSEAYELTSSILPNVESSSRTGELTYTSKEEVIVTAYSSHAKAAAGLKKTIEASKAVDKMTIHPNDFYTSRTRAEINYIEGNWQQTVDTVLKLYIIATPQEKDSPDGIEALFLLGKSYFELGNMNKAKEAYEKFLTANKYEPEAFFNLGQIYLKLGDKQRAIENYSSAIQLRNDFSEALTNRGTLYLAAEQYNNAVLDFSAVLNKEPRNMDVLYKRAYSLCVNGDSGKGREDLAMILRINPKNSQAKQLRAHCN